MNIGNSKNVIISSSSLDFCCTFLAQIDHIQIVTLRPFEIDGVAETHASALDRCWLAIISSFSSLSSLVFHNVLSPHVWLADGWKFCNHVDWFSFLFFRWLIGSLFCLLFIRIFDWFSVLSAHHLHLSSPFVSWEFSVWSRTKRRKRRPTSIRKWRSPVKKRTRSESGGKGKEARRRESRGKKERRKKWLNESKTDK